MSTERIVGLLVVLVMFAIAIVGYRRRASTEATDNHGPWTLFLYPEKGDEGAIIYPDLYRTLQECRAAPLSHSLFENDVSDHECGLGCVRAGTDVQYDCTERRR